MRHRVWVLAVADVLVAVVVADLVFRLVGAVAGEETNPPTCSNAAGLNVSCELTQPVVMIPAFLLVLVFLATLQVLARRRAPRVYDDA